MEFKKSDDGSYLVNCFVSRRERDPCKCMFYQNGDKNISAFLNGYAIIPLEEYFRLKNENGENGYDWPEDILKRVEEADKQLHDI